MKHYLLAALSMAIIAASTPALAQNAAPAPQAQPKPTGNVYVRCITDEYNRPVRCEREYQAVSFGPPNFVTAQPEPRPSPLQQFGQALLQSTGQVAGAALQDRLAYEADRKIRGNDLFTYGYGGTSQGNRPGGASALCGRPGSGC